MSGSAEDLVSEMAYNVSTGTLNPTIPYSEKSAGCVSRSQYIGKGKGKGKRKRSGHLL